jgi:hypothetical protein
MLNAESDLHSNHNQTDSEEIKVISHKAWCLLKRKEQQLFFKKVLKSAER